MGFIKLGQVGSVLNRKDRISFSQLRSGIITAQELVIGGGTDGVIRSQNYDGASGWAIFGDGSAFFGGNVEFAGDIHSANWDGTIPIDLSGTWSTGYDTGATTGFAFDSSLGRAQISDFLWIGQGSTGDMLVFDAASSSTTTAIDFLRGGDKAADIYAAGDDVDNTTFHIRSLRSGSGSLTFAAESTGAGTASLTSGGTFKADEFWGSWNGSATQPTYSWSGDQNTGFYRTAENEIGITLGGVVRFLSTVTYFKGVTATGSFALYSIAGGASLPTYTFRGDNDTGLYRDAANKMAFAASGSKVMSIDTGYLRTGAEGVGQAAIRLGAAGTAGAPAFTFSSDADTGMYRAAANTIGFSTAGTLGFSISGTQVHSILIRDDTTGSAATLWISSVSGLMRRSTSARKYKSRITYNVDYLADYELRPAKFYRKDDKRWFYGLIADDVAEQDELFGTYNEDGDVENYDDRMVIAVLVAKVNRLEEKLAQA